MKTVDVVIPVYDGFDETRACLASVLQTVDLDWARLIVINDCSPNPDITAYLRSLQQEHSELVLLENESNLGFVATANRGLSYSKERDVLLLNSDVEVSGDWLSLLRMAAYSDASVGSVTPFSNNATICSFPNFCKDNSLLFGLNCEELSGYFSTLFYPGEVVDVPTGVGFCMYIRRDCLEQVGLFNEELFGRGYGEENDWCQRARADGWRNVHTAACFVYHKGGVSFAETQKPAVARAMEILDRCYPGYHRSVQEYIAVDPVRKYRIAALLAAFAGTCRPKVAFVNHSLGGGAQQHVEELARLYRDQALFLQISPESGGESVRVSFYDGGDRLFDGLYFNIDQHYDVLVNLLRQLGIGRLHFHHTMGLHPRFWGIARDLGCPHDLTVHDYYLLNGNPTLTDDSASFVSEQQADFDQRCASHYPLPPGVDAAHWRDSQRPLVEGAERVIFPSRDCAHRFGRFFDVQEACVAWHPDYTESQPSPEPSWDYPGGRPLRVLVLGAISREKGADTLDEVATGVDSSEVEFHLLGYAYRALGSSVVTHGPYDNTDVDGLVAAIEPDVIWLPARWPETYSYTLSIALRLALPIVVPDIGAFPERVAGRAFSIVKEWNTPVSDWCEFWSSVARNGSMPEAVYDSGVIAADPGSNSFYWEAYLGRVPPTTGEIDSTLYEILESHHSPGVHVLSRRERILAWMWRLSRSSGFSKLLALVPFRLQRAIKRRFSSRPMHDIVRG